MYMYMKRTMQRERETINQYDIDYERASTPIYNIGVRRKTRRTRVKTPTLEQHLKREYPNPWDLSSRRNLEKGTTTRRQGIQRGDRYTTRQRHYGRSPHKDRSTRRTLGATSPVHRTTTRPNLSMEGTESTGSERRQRVEGQSGPGSRDGELEGLHHSGMGESSPYTRISSTHKIRVV